MYEGAKGWLTTSMHWAGGLAEMIMQVPMVG